jgi:hypothetical protein
MNLLLPISSPEESIPEFISHCSLITFTPTQGLSTSTGIPSSTSGQYCFADAPRTFFECTSPATMVAYAKADVLVASIAKDVG